MYVERGRSGAKPAHSGPRLSFHQIQNNHTEVYKDGPNLENQELSSMSTTNDNRELPRNQQSSSPQRRTMDSNTGSEPAKSAIQSVLGENKNSPQSRVNSTASGPRHREDSGGPGNTVKINMKEKEGNDLNPESEVTILDLKDQLMRSIAQNENLRKRHQKELEDMSKYSMSKIFADLIVPLEQVYLALEAPIPEDLASNPAMQNQIQGLEMIKGSFENVFKNNGLHRICPIGEVFDANFHQATAQVETTEVPSGHVLKVIQAGYQLHDRVIKPALVIVAK